MRRIAATLLLLISATTIFAASEFPPEYRWRTITTQHFYIDFHQGEDALAARAAVIAERAHARLVPFMGWKPSERTHIILTDHVDVSNGNANPFPQNRIEVFVSAPGADPSSAIEYYDDWLNLVIVHEYTHILHLDQARGFSAGMRKVFGRTPYFSFPNLYSPSWFVEGIATLTESEFTQTGRLKGTYEDMVLRTAAIEGRFATEAQASGNTPVWPEAGARYFYGSKFLAWLASTRGPDKLREFMNDYSANVIPFNGNRSAEDVYQTSLSALWRQWSSEQQTEYKTQYQRIAAAGLTPHERLTTLGYATQNLLLSPDGKRLAFANEGPYELPTLRVMDLSSGREVATLTVHNASAISWSSDGQRIAYSQLEFVRSFSLISDLYVWDVRGKTRQVTHNARLKDPSFTPDGRTLVAVENRAGRNRLVEVDITSGAVRPIVAPDDFRLFSEPAVSHDGQRIAVAEWNNGSIDVVLYDRSGARIANLTESMPRVTNASPRFSRDDATIYFSSDATGVTNLYSVSARGGDIKRLTNVYGGAFYPTTSDGRRFYYADYSAAGFDVAMFDASRTYDITPREIPRSVVGRTDIKDDVGAGDDTGAPRSGSYSALRSIRPRWWFPIITSGGVGGTTAGGDVLGFHTYTASIATDGFYSFVYSYDRLYPTLSLGTFHDKDASDTTRRFFADATFPLRHFLSRSAVSVSILRDELNGFGNLQGVRVGGFFTTARQFAYSVSREDGITAQAAYETLGGDASVQRIRGDLRGYLGIPYSRSPLGRHVIAARIAAAQNSGDFVQQRELRVGGNEDTGFPAFETERLPVRGYDENTLRGQGAAIASVEYRFPLYEIERGPTTFPLFFNRLVGDVFIDAGRAWRQRVPQSTIASTGAEFGVDVYLAYNVPLRYRFGVAYLLRNPDKGRVQPYFAIETSF